MANIKSKNTYHTLNLFYQYVFATQSLLNLIKEKEEIDISNHIFPVAYLFRHSLEIGIKLLYELVGREGYPTGHSLRELKEKFENLVKVHNGIEVVVALSSKQSDFLKIIFDKSEKTKKQTYEEFESQFDNYNLTKFLRLLDKYYDEDNKNIKYRYAENEITLKEKIEQFNEIESDIDTLNDLVGFLHILAYAAHLEHIKKV